MIKCQHVCKIVCNKRITPRLFCLSLQAPALTRKALPGQFIHVRVSNGLKPFFRRPFSIYRAQKTLDILYDVVGDGTRALSKKVKAENIDCLGPLGTPFAMPPKGVKQVVMIAGGVGVAPFLALTDILKKKNYQFVLLYGARDKDHVFSLKEFEKNGCQAHVATDDGSRGAKGRVSILFSKIDLNLPTYIYTCGPKPMMARVQEFARENHLRGQASLEDVMACGVGVCLGCAVKTTQGFKTACHDGPVFDLGEIIF